MSVREFSMECRVTDGQGLLSAAIRTAEGLDALGIRHHEFRLLPIERAFVVGCLGAEPDAVRVFNEARTRGAGGAFPGVKVSRFYVNPTTPSEMSSLIVHLGDGTHADVERVLSVVAEQGVSFLEASSSPNCVLDLVGFSAITAPSASLPVVRAVAGLEECLAGSAATLACVPSAWLAAINATTTSVVLRFDDHAGALAKALDEASALPGVKEFLSAHRLNAQTFEAHLRVRHATVEDAQRLISGLDHLRNGKGVVTEAFSIRGRSE